MRREHSHQSEKRRVKQADTPFYVELIVRIIPPLSVEKFF